jgi:transposase
VNILNLPGWTVTDVKTGANDYRVEATYDTEPTACPHCASQGRMFGAIYRHGGKAQLIMDLPAHGKRMGVNLYRKRYRCRDCLRTFPQPLPDVEDRSSMTRRLVAYIEKESIRRTFVSIADDVGVNEKTVRNVFASYVEWLDANVTFETPVWLGIDELHLLKKPRMIVTNVKERTIIGVGESRKKASVLTYLSRLRDQERIEVVTMDMWKPYRDSVREVLPKAVVVVDKFHVVRMASQCLDAVRKKIREGMTAVQRRKLVRERFLLLRRPKDLVGMDKLKLDAWLANLPELKAAYDLNSGFYCVYDHTDKRAALDALVAWEASMTPSMRTAFKPLLTALENWRGEIFAYFDHRATNACTEALNGIAKNINRNGRGYSFAAIRAKMLYSKTLQKERKPAYGEEWGPKEGPPETPRPGVPIEYLDHRDGMAEEPLLGTDLMSLWALLDPASVLKANGNGRHHSTDSLHQDPPRE